MKLLSRTPRTNKAYLFFSFSWIKIQTKNEDVHVTKLVVLVTRIPLSFLGIFLIFLRISRHFQISQQNLEKPN